MTIFHFDPVVEGGEGSNKLRVTEYELQYPNHVKIPDFMDFSLLHDYKLV